MITLTDILTATGGAVADPTHAHTWSDFCYDSRRVQPGQMFVAVRTEVGDGHQHIAAACRGGATGVLCERLPEGDTSQATVIVVPDTREALKAWAAHVLRRYGPEIIAVGGSTGKTSTKEAVAAVLARRHATFATHSNYNDTYGVPLALGRLQPEHRKAVIEMAADGFGELAELARLAPPRIAIVTNVNHTHLRDFGSLEAIAEEMTALVVHLPPDGTAILGADDARVLALHDRTRARLRTFGFAENADLRASDVTCDVTGTAFTLHLDGERHPVRLRLLGPHSPLIALAAVAAGLACGVPVEEAIAALAEFAPLRGRLNPLPGCDGALLLDDTHNAAPATALAALETLRRLPARRRVAVFGDMTGLGAYTDEGHALVGRAAAGIVDHLITRGDQAETIARAAIAAGLPPERVTITYAIEHAIDAASFKFQVSSSKLETPQLGTWNLEPGTLILVKGSEPASMERVPARLLADPSTAHDVLDRQDVPTEHVTVRPERPTWVEVDLGAIAGNVRRLREIVGPRTELMAILKADGYGHGALKVARTVLWAGARWLGVAALGEAVPLREAGITAPILILGYTPDWQARDVVRYGMEATIFGRESARALSRAGVALQRVARVHVKVDTGMSRLGLACDPPEAVADLVAEVMALPSIEVRGIFTHFAKADSRDHAFAREQLARFQRVLDALAARGLRIPIVHAANSAGTLSLPEARFDLVRTGIAMYGLQPSSEVTLPAGFRPALAFKTQLAQVRHLPAGSYVSYGCTFQAPRDMVTATLPVGYADGFRRGPTNWGEVLIRERRAPIVGVVCMDQCVVDVSHIPDVHQGDEAVLIGRQGEAELPVEEVAAHLGTINYEVVSEILARVPRIS